MGLKMKAIEYVIKLETYLYVFSSSFLIWIKIESIHD